MDEDVLAPVRSWWKPDATSMSAPGGRGPQRPASVAGAREDLEHVDLPAPFRPMSPIASPGRTQNDTSCTAQNSRRSSASRRRSRNSFAASAGTMSRRLS